jgi:DME family drug/metabolite transporter
MNLIFKIPGPLLVFFGACSLSFGGLIVKSFEGATLWQILFWRSLFFIMVVFIFLLISYKKKIFRAFYNSGIPGIFGGIILSSGFCGYVFAMYNTTVANTNFIIQTQTIFLAIFGYFFLKEKISKITLVSIFLAISGIILMVGSDLEPGQMSGNLAAFIMPVSFAILILIIRKYPNIDMVPLQLYAGITAMIIGYIIAGKINISAHDIFLGFLAGFFQLGFGFILITIGARSTPSAMVGIIMLTEAVLGPFWAWLFINENSSFMVLIGGTIVIIAVLLQFYTSIKNENQTILNK